MAGSGSPPAAPEVCAAVLAADAASALQDDGRGGSRLSQGRRTDSAIDTRRVTAGIVHASENGSLCGCLCKLVAARAVGACGAGGGGPCSDRRRLRCKRSHRPEHIGSRCGVRSAEQREQEPQGREDAGDAPTSSTLPAPSARHGARGERGVRSGEARLPGASNVSRVRPRSLRAGQPAVTFGPLNNDLACSCARTVATTLGTCQGGPAVQC